MRSSHSLDRLDTAFDDDRLVADAGLLLPATLAHHLGLQRAGRAPSRPRCGARPGARRRQAPDARHVGARGRRLHRRRGRPAGGRHRPGPGLHREGGLDPRHVPAQLPLGPRPPARRGQPGAPRAGLGGRRRTGRRAAHDRSRLDDLRDLRPRRRRARSTTATPGCGATTPCSRWPPAPATCSWRACARAAPTPCAAPPTSCARRSAGCDRPAPAGQLTMRADSGFYAHDVVAVCRDDGRPLQHHGPPAPGRPPLDRGDPRDGLDARSRTGSTAAPTWPRRRIPRSPTSQDATPGAAHRAPGAAHARAPSSRSSPSTTTTPSSPTGRATTLELEADHRRHAEIENAIRDLKYGVGLNHLPSGRFAANGAWLAVQVMAHNLARWTARIGLDDGHRHHQDPAPAAVQPRRAAHPLGPPPDAPSAGPLALGDRASALPWRGSGRSRSSPDAPSKPARPPGDPAQPALAASAALGRCPRARRRRWDGCRRAIRSSPGHPPGQAAGSALSRPGQPELRWIRGKAAGFVGAHEADCACRASTASTTSATGSTRRQARCSASSTPPTRRPRTASIARPTALWHTPSARSSRGRRGRPPSRTSSRSRSSLPLVALQSRRPWRRWKGSESQARQRHGILPSMATDAPRADCR